MNCNPPQKYIKYVFKPNIIKETCMFRISASIIKYALEII